MKQKVIEHPDDHLVIHDAASVGIATALGLIGAAVTGSPEVGLLTAGVVAGVGISAMKIPPVRRAVNTTVLASTKSSDAKD